jgi:hypothetical protein
MLRAGRLRRNGSRRWCHNGFPHLRWSRATIPGGHPGAAPAHGHKAGSGEEQGNAGTIQDSTPVGAAILGRWLKQRWPECDRCLCH